MRILIATGGSEYSFMAVERACEMLVEPENCEIRIISVYQKLAEISPEPLEVTAEEIEDIQNIERLRSTEYALRAEEIIKRKFPGRKLNISFKVEGGSAKKLILREAEQWRADLIVVGSLGHNFLSRLFLGSVSESIVRRAPCSVLVVRGEIETNGRKTVNE